MKVFSFEDSQLIAKINRSGPLHGLGIDDAFYNRCLTEINRADSRAKTGERYSYPGTRQAPLLGLSSTERRALRSELLRWTHLPPDEFALAGLDLVQFAPTNGADAPMYCDGLMGEYNLFIALDCANDAEWLVTQNHHPHPHLRPQPQPSVAHPRLNVTRGSSAHEPECRSVCSLEPGKWVFTRGHDCAHGIRSRKPCWILRIRLNRRSIDPEGVDPVLNYFVDQSPLLAEQASDEQLPKLRLLLSPRVDHLRTTFSRQNWRTYRHVKFSDGRTLSISTEEFDLLYQLDRSKLAERLIWPPKQQRFSESTFLRMCLLEGLLIVAPEPRNMPVLEALFPPLARAG